MAGRSLLRQKRPIGLTDGALFDAVNQDRFVYGEGGKEMRRGGNGKGVPCARVIARSAVCGR